MIVRTAVPGDMAAMLDAVEVFSADRYPGDTIDRKHVEGVLWDIALLESCLVAVMETDAGAFAGMFAALAHKALVTGKTVCGEVFFYVDPSSRGHGRKLLRFAEEWASDIGCRSMMLCHMEATPRLETAYRFWGYVPQERLYRKELT